MFEKLKYKYNLAFALADAEIATKYLLRENYKKCEYYTNKAKRKFENATKLADKVEENKIILSELRKVINKLEEKIIGL